MESLNINPWLEIWTRPKKTMRAILNWDPKRVVIWLAVLGGILSGFIWLALYWIKHPDAKANFWVILAALVTGAILGVITLYFSSWLYHFTGKWLKGEGTFTEVKSAVGWANYPFIVANIFNLISFFTTKNTWASGLLGIIYAILGIWAFVIFLNLLAEAHKFSAWKSLLTVIIAFALVFIVMMILVLIIPLLSPLFTHHS